MYVSTLCRAVIGQLLLICPFRLSLRTRLDNHSRLSVCLEIPADCQLSLRSDAARRWFSEPIGAVYLSQSLFEWPKVWPKQRRQRRPQVCSMQPTLAMLLRRYFGTGDIFESRVIVAPEIGDRLTMGCRLTDPADPNESADALQTVGHFEKAYADCLNKLMRVSSRQQTRCD